MQIETTRFGAVEVDTHHIIHFRDGLPGFESKHQFVLLPHTRPGGDSPFEWLQSVEDGELAFLAMRPHQVFPEYQPRIPVAELEAIGVDKGGPSPDLLTLLTVPRGNPNGITANLVAPVVVNPQNRLARQVIVNNEEYGFRHRLIPD
jgi:flagellar assembly factor FliW